MRRWDRDGRLSPELRTLGGHRRYRLAKPDKLKVGYARVSSHDQRKDLETQRQFLSGHCDVVLTDLGSGLNCKKPRLRKLVSMLLTGEIDELHLTHKDRLLRFGHELVKDVITLMTVFSARLYGRRSHQNKIALAA